MQVRHKSDKGLREKKCCWKR